jgi:cytosine deaminase
VIERALAYCDWAASMGLLAIRTHVDVCDDRLLAVEALLEVKGSGDRALHRPATGGIPAGRAVPVAEARENTIRALDLGVEVVGGIPHFERTMADGRASVTELCEIAAERGSDGRHALRRDRRSDVASYRATGL